MSDQATYIPFGGIGEIEFNVGTKDWHKCDSTELNEYKAIPIVKLLIDLVGARAKYYQNQTRIGRYENHHQLAKDIFKEATGLSCSFIKINKLSDNMFSTGDIQTIDYCLEVYRQYTSVEAFDPFLWNAWETERTISLLQPELLKFKKDIIKLVSYIKKLIHKNSFAKVTPFKLQRLFMDHLRKQFRKVIIKDGKSKSDFCRYFREIELLDTAPIFIKIIFFYAEIFLSRIFLF